MSGVPTVTELLLARRDDPGTGLKFEDRTWPWADCVRESAVRAALLTSLLDPAAVPHVGILADNVPEFSLLLGGAALSGTVLVGLNTTRRGAALARDIRISDCRLVLAESAYLPLVAETDVPVIDLDGPEWTALLDAHQDAPVRAVRATPQDLLMLIFTSGTSGDPKAVRCTHGKIAFPGRMLADRFGLSGSDTVYVSMPMFHSNAIMAGWSVGLAAGAAIALRRRFSASGFLADVRRFGATYANYVGKPLSYVVATPRRDDDADNPLRVVYGNEGAEADLAEFGARFGCHVVDAFGSTEGGIGIVRTPDSPPGSLGRLTDEVRILHPDTGEPCPPAEFAPDGSLLNAAEAVGELVNMAGPGWFAGYYNDPDADADRLRHGRYHTGDLAYSDAGGYAYFAGRSSDWLRVDGENLGTAPIERILLRHPRVAEAVVYAVPDRVGDQVMAALVPEAGATLDPAEFGDFLARQADLGPKQLPRYLRITAELPKTATFKVVKRTLAAERWDCRDPVWRRRDTGTGYELVSAKDDVPRR
ncbi:long-chain-fatty-acid--CoA ligase [Prauserella oleivorans]|uniref:Long-chain-fatty-acid--CoA ligase n=1 Tax=Prauserella oleivorans TaxID=1478153 RepID=A0ABW5WEB7_9PSEU